MKGAKAAKAPPAKERALVVVAPPPKAVAPPANGAVKAPAVVCPPAVDPAVSLKAASALLAHLNKKGTTLIDDPALLYVTFNLKKQPGRSFPKPVRVALPTPVFDPASGAEVCLIVKDGANEIAEHLLKVPVLGLTKVITVSSLKTKYKAFQHRRPLVSQFKAFFADDRVVTMMPKLCGNTFSNPKKMPTPVRLTVGDISKELEAARDASYLYVGAQCTSIRVGRADNSAEEVAANMTAAVAAALPHFAKGLKGVLSIYLSATDSVSLPLYKALPSLSMAAEDDSEDDEGSEGSDEEDDEEEGDEEDEAPEVPVILASRPKAAVAAPAAAPKAGPVAAAPKAAAAAPKAAAAPIAAATGGKRARSDAPADGPRKAARKA
jgi:ribosome biogenesis protein UTP30